MFETHKNEGASIIDFLQGLVEQKGTDLIICVGKPPQIRVSGSLKSLEFPPLSGEEAKAFCYQIMTEKQQKDLESNWEVDFSFGVPQLSRFRGNVFVQRGSVSGAFRRIPHEIMTFEELGLPKTVQDFSTLPNGLILVTGQTGSGKSTTLAAMINQINETRYNHIISIEDPIEYLHKHKKSTVEQREVSIDTKTFDRALKSILRQDPDVVLIGEMRDTESIQAALTIAETGHLCFATLHTSSCAQTLSRIVDVFNGDKQQQILTQLSMTLKGVLSQTLIPKIGGGIQLALEVMVATPAIRALIRENKIHNIDTQLQLGSKFGMYTMNQSLVSLVKSGLVSEDDALAASPDHDDFRKCMYY